MMHRLDLVNPGSRRVGRVSARPTILASVGLADARPTLQGCLISAWHELKIDPSKWMPKGGPVDDEPRDVLRFPTR